MSTSPSALLVPVFMGACFGIFNEELSVKRNSKSKRNATAQELCESRCGRRGIPVPNSPYDLCGRKATLNSKSEVFIFSASDLAGHRDPGATRFVQRKAV